MYVPYIADALIQANDTKYFKLGGIAVSFFPMDLLLLLLTLHG